MIEKGVNSEATMSVNHSITHVLQQGGFRAEDLIRQIRVIAKGNLR